MQIMIIINHVNTKCQSRFEINYPLVFYSDSIILSIEVSKK